MMSHESDQYPRTPTRLRAPARGFSYGLHVLRVRPTNGRTGASRSRSRYTPHVGAKQRDKADGLNRLLELST